MKYLTTSGFTLIETMVAVSILTLSIAGPLFAANRAIVSAATARDRLTASYLAQEGVEYVRAMRDDVFLVAYQAGGAGVSDTAWANFLTFIAQCRPTGAEPTKACSLDTYPTVLTGVGSGLSLESCTGNACTRPLYLVNGVYTLQSNLGGVQKPFSRTVQVVDISGTPDTYPDKRIVSTVSWNYHNTPYSVTVTDHLTPWQ